MSLVWHVVAVIYGTGIVGSCEPHAEDTKARVRDAELLSLKNEAQQTGDAIARQFDQIRALFQATGAARIGLNTDDILRAIDAKDDATLRRHLSDVHRAMPPEVLRLGVAGREQVGTTGYWTVLAGTDAYQSISPGESLVRAAPGPGQFSNKADTVRDFLYTGPLPPYRRLAPYVVYSPGFQLVDLCVPILDSAGSNRGEFIAEMRIDQLLTEISLPQPAPGKDVYLTDADGRLIRRMARALESGLDLT